MSVSRPSRTRLALVIGTVVLAAVVGLYLRHERDERLRAEARAERLEQERDSAHAAVGRLRVVAEAEAGRADSARAALDSVRAASARQLAAAREEERAAETSLAVAGRTLDATLDTLARRAPPELRPVVWDARAQLATEREASRAVAVALRSQVVAHETELRATQATLSRTGEALRASQALVRGLEEELRLERALADLWRAQARPGLLTRIARGAESHLIAGAVGVLVGGGVALWLTR